MTNSFLNSLNNAAATTSTAITENGATGFARTRHALTDFFFKVGSMRAWSNEQIINEFMQAYAEDKQHAVELMFLVRDCRGGQGEKRVFTVIFNWLAKTNPDLACALLKLVPEYGSWKTFFDLMGLFLSTSDVDKNVLGTAQEIFMSQWDADIDALHEEKSISLMAKWAPSINTSSRKTRNLAHMLKTILGISERDYRKTLASLRSYSKVLEVKMSAKQWSEIDYNAVPSRAGVIYRNAFLKNDEDRRRKWLESLKKNDGTAKINVETLDVVTLVKKYLNISGYRVSLNAEDATLEAAWKALVEKGRLDESAPNFIPVIDGSGSMYWDNGTNTRAIEVALGLGLYFANINKEPWRGNVIEFGSRPWFYKISTEASLHDQLAVAIQHNDCGSTNVEAVFDLVLKAAVDKNLTSREIPQIVVYSDLEFNVAMNSNAADEHLFDAIAAKWSAAGYLLPKLFFWNINNRSGAFPMVENPNGLGLVSGYSQQIMNMMLSGKTDPYEILLEKLATPRYDLVRQVFKSC